ncbi:PREDICTED: zona pellucida-binding protein 1 [Gekko japonicus]|uniref:Zona pellucida-binding protein 1 n=1 Tax=Gekko japonicus TaxID=146911 RepID=A0ABM1JHN0_GEKJA|nr:PREDICTED: zona pellucida-binding protein 1 [Gekko japonicus]
MRRRGRRRRPGPSSALAGSQGRLLGLALMLALGLPSGLFAPKSANVHCSSGIDPNGVKVVGSTNLPVKVYVKMNFNSPRILCITSHLRNSELIDPIFQWHGPGGDMVTENQTVKITPTGTLLFRQFKPEMSGVYTCSLVFKPTTEQSEKSYLIKYVLYGPAHLLGELGIRLECGLALGVPNRSQPPRPKPPSLHQKQAFIVRYHAAPCNSIYNTSFEKKLLQILSKLVVGLSCEIALQTSECHHVKMQRAGLQNVLFFTFTVSSLEPEKGKSTCEKSACDISRRLRKAKDLIEKFFNQQVQVLGKQKPPLPEIYYIEGTLQMVWINRCAPGYGINPLLHPDCPHCCVVCSPGSYNPREGVHCLQCNKSLAYGSKTC